MGIKLFSNVDTGIHGMGGIFNNLDGTNVYNSIEEFNRRAAGTALGGTNIAADGKIDSFGRLPNQSEQIKIKALVDAFEKKVKEICDAETKNEGDELSTDLQFMGGSIANVNYKMKSKEFKEFVLDVISLGEPINTSTIEVLILNESRFRKQKTAIGIGVGIAAGVGAALLYNKYNSDDDDDNALVDDLDIIDEPSTDMDELDRIMGSAGNEIQSSFGIDAYR